MLQGLNGLDQAAERFAIGGFTSVRQRLSRLVALRQQAAKSSQTNALKMQIKALRRETTQEGALWYTRSLQRFIHTDTGFRERLVAFWADHFTARGKKPLLAFATAPYVEEAIRPQINGNFADLLIAATLHPLMLHFLDQAGSVGPNSPAAKRSKKLKGLNENLAREVLELHTLGVDGPYSQTDVRQLAKLFTGLSYSRGLNFRFRPGFAETGTETVLGITYGSDPASLAPIEQSLRDLAVHPATARHIAQKLAVHFVSDTPDPALVQHIEGRFIDTGGDLMAIYDALLNHPSAWKPILSNVKPPADFVASACRALVPAPDQIKALNAVTVRRLFLRPLALMGQSWNRPNGPDGWAEEDTAWVTPQGISARLHWAFNVPQKLRPALPDPRDFVVNALGPFAPQPVQFAANAAESKSDAIGLILAAPAFQRR